jgi:hypothetical protein
MSHRRALAAETWQRARAAGFPIVALEHFTVGRGKHPWHRFLVRAGLGDLRAAVAALDRIQHPQPTAGPSGGATEKENDR